MRMENEPGLMRMENEPGLMRMENEPGLRAQGCLFLLLHILFCAYFTCLPVGKHYYDDLLTTNQNVLLILQVNIIV